ncbi:MAG: polyamine transporter ATP-binding protein, partial [Rickettsiaceae bacterium]|nr:polyamine transporter ATP-binding protein [Rickettsiaceae bacterium]
MNGLNNGQNFQNKKPMVVLESVCKQYPGSSTKAVDNVSVNIYEGELFALLGPSGCGKTTIMRMLAGFETPTSGKIIIDGVDILNIPAYERSVNMMFQSYALFPHMTVEQN